MRRKDRIHVPVCWQRKGIVMSTAIACSLGASFPLRLTRGEMVKSPIPWYFVPYLGRSDRHISSLTLLEEEDQAVMGCWFETWPFMLALRHNYVVEWASLVGRQLLAMSRLGLPTFT